MMDGGWRRLERLIATRKYSKERGYPILSTSCLCAFACESSNKTHNESLNNTASNSKQQTATREGNGEKLNESSKALQNWRLKEWRGEIPSSQHIASTTRFTIAHVPILQDKVHHKKT